MEMILKSALIRLLPKIILNIKNMLYYKDNSRIFLKDNSDIAEEIENKIIAITQGNKTSMDHAEDNVEESE